MEPRDRIHSIDAFRGMTIAGMVLVNLPGSWGQLYPPLSHAKWHGWTATDFVFPFFLFAIGLSMAFSFSKRKQAESSGKLVQHIFRRSGILFGLGLFLNTFPHFSWAKLRIPGVLQRIALAYLFAGLLSVRFRWRKLIWVSAGLLLLYWLMMTLIPVPGYGPGVLTAEGNFGAYVDRLFLKGHLYRKMWDPEGLFGTLPAIVNILAGVVAGHFLRMTKFKAETASWLFVWGWILIFAGLFWGIWFPINKKLWTSSYVLFSSGAALQLLGFLYWFIDVQKKRTWFQPALVLGNNALTLYILHILYIKVIRILIRFPLENGKTISLYHWMYLNWFASWAGPLNGSLIFAICHVAGWLGLMWFFYRRGIFFKI